jgi:hypothetical protein
MGELGVIKEWQWQDGSDNGNMERWASGSGRVAVLGSVGKSAKK